MADDKITTTADKAQKPQSTPAEVSDINALYRSLPALNKPADRGAESPFRKVSESTIEASGGRTFTTKPDGSCVIKWGTNEIQANYGRLAADGSLQWSIGSGAKEIKVEEKPNGTRVVTGGGERQVYNGATLVSTTPVEAKLAGAPPPTDASKGKPESAKPEAPRTEAPARADVRPSTEPKLSPADARRVNDWENASGMILRRLPENDKPQKALFPIVQQAMKDTGLEAKGWILLPTEVGSPLDQVGCDYAMVNKNSGQVVLLDATQDPRKLNGGKPVPELRRPGVIEFNFRHIDKLGGLIKGDGELEQGAKRFGEDLHAQLVALAKNPPPITVDMLPSHLKQSDPEKTQAEVKKFRESLNEKAQQPGLDDGERRKLRAYSSDLVRTDTFNTETLATKPSKELTEVVKKQAETALLQWAMEKVNKKPAKAEAAGGNGDVKLIRGDLQVRIDGTNYSAGNVNEILEQTRTALFDKKKLHELIAKELRTDVKDPQVAKMASAVQDVLISSKDSLDKSGLDLAVKTRVSRMNSDALVEKLTGKAPPGKEVAPKVEAFTPAEQQEIKKMAEALEDLGGTKIKDAINPTELKYFIEVYLADLNPSEAGRKLAERYIAESSKPQQEQKFNPRFHGAFEQAMKALPAKPSSDGGSGRGSSARTAPEAIPVDQLKVNKMLLADDIIQGFDKQVRELMPDLAAAGAAKDTTDAGNRLRNAMVDYFHEQGIKDGGFRKDSMNIVFDKSADKARVEFWKAGETKAVVLVGAEFQTADGKKVSAAGVTLRITLPESLLKGTSTELSKALYAAVVEQTNVGETNAATSDSIRNHVGKVMDKGEAAQANATSSKPEAGGLNVAKLPEAAAEPHRLVIGKNGVQVPGSDETFGLREIPLEISRRLQKEIEEEQRKGNDKKVAELKKLKEHEDLAYRVLGDPNHARYAEFQAREHARVEVYAKGAEAARKRGGTGGAGEARGRLVVITSIAAFVMSKMDFGE